jgi:hypothetical protein
MYALYVILAMWVPTLPLQVVLAMWVPTLGCVSNVGTHFRLRKQCGYPLYHFCYLVIMWVTTSTLLLLGKVGTHFTTKVRKVL